MVCYIRNLITRLLFEDKSVNSVLHEHVIENNHVHTIYKHSSFTLYMLPVISCEFFTQPTLRGCWSCSLCCEVHQVTGRWSCSWSSGRKGSSLSTLWWSLWRKSLPKTLILLKSHTNSPRWIFSVKQGRYYVCLTFAQHLMPTDL